MLRIFIGASFATYFEVWRKKFKVGSSKSCSDEKFLIRQLFTCEKQHLKRDPGISIISGF